MFFPSSNVRDSLHHWARKATTSFAELGLFPQDAGDSKLDGDELIYRLKRWPHLPDASRTAGVLRTLSVMSNRPVNRRWILSNSKLRAAEVDRLLRRLVDQGAVEVIDSSRFAAA